MKMLISSQNLGLEFGGFIVFTQDVIIICSYLESVDCYFFIFFVTSTIRFTSKGLV